MKQKFTILVAMICLTAVAMAAQPQLKQQRACDVVKMEQQKGKMVYTPSVAETKQQGDFSLYSPNQAPRQVEGEIANEATVTFIFNLSDEELAAYYCASVMVYNPGWSEIYHPSRYDDNGNLVKGIIVKVPFDTYDIYTNTYEQMGSYRQIRHIDEMVTIDKDTTIYLDLVNSEVVVSWNIYNSDNELFEPQTVRFIDHDPWMEVVTPGNLKTAHANSFIWLEGYGPVMEAEIMYDAKSENSPNPGSFYINELSNRYLLLVVENEVGNDGMFYVNRVSSQGTEGLPMENNPSDYVLYEEELQATPKGLETVENPIAGFGYYVFYENSQELFNNLTGMMPIADDRVARVMINASKIGVEQLTGVNVAVALQVVDLESPGDFESSARIEGPKVMANQDGSLEFPVYRIGKTPEVDVWRDDYPAHPKFSFTFDQKKGVVGNSCPLKAVAFNNKWNQWRNANLIDFKTNDYLGRFGEIIGSGNRYSTMVAKYNDEEIYSGDYALDYLRIQWATANPDGAYELEFTNANVAVDDIEGKNVTTVYFDQRKEDQNPPALVMLQLRDAENSVTDRFGTPDDGMLMFAGGDFDPRSFVYDTFEIDGEVYESVWSYFECQPMEVEVSYAPYGTDEWLPLEGVEHQAEYDDIPGLGFFYSAPLTSVTTPSENCWFDLKFRLVDEAGNWQEQILSPAFRIEDVTQSAVIEVKVDRAADNAIYNLAGQRMRGNLNSLPHGIYITAGKKIVK